jgi:hypothetical protein
MAFSSIRLSGDQMVDLTPASIKQGPHAERVAHRVVERDEYADDGDESLVQRVDAPHPAGPPHAAERDRDAREAERSAGSGSRTAHGGKREQRRQAPREGHQWLPTDVVVLTVPRTPPQAPQTVRTYLPSDAAGRGLDGETAAAGPAVPATHSPPPPLRSAGGSSGGYFDESKEDVRCV